MTVTNQSPLFYQSNSNLPIVKKARGCHIWDVDDKQYIDASSGAITVNMGHAHPTIQKAMIGQLDKIAFSYRTQFESQAALDLGTKLVALNGGTLDKVYFVGSGSESVESCLKLAIQYFYECGQPQRHVFVSLRPSYHGSTLGALGVTAYQPLEKPFVHNTLASLKVPGPNYYRKTQTTDAEHDEQCLQEAKDIIESHGAEKIAGFILEPVGGASTGARVLSDTYLKGVRKICDDIGALLIFDEVMTGMGRTGKWFGWQHSGVEPDLMSLAKGLGAGYYPVGAMLAKSIYTDRVVASGGFMHGHTYAGNPLACATGLGVIKAMEDENVVENARAMGESLLSGLRDLQSHYPIIGNVRGIGLLTAIEFVSDLDSKEPYPVDWNVFSLITNNAKKEGLLVYPRRCLDGIKGDHILITPPLIIDKEILEELLSRLERVLQTSTVMLTKRKSQ